MKSLKLATPFGGTFLRALLYLILFCAALEGFARTPAASSLFPRESYGTSHPHFEVQLRRLRDRVAAGETVDCIFIGNSQVLFGLQPAVVEQAYREQSGRSLHCQNFGLGGLTPRTAGPLARVLIKNFHPALIVFETGVLDYSTSNMEGTDASIMSSPWMQYQLGTFSVDGWLYEHSQAFRLVFGIDRAINAIEEEHTDIAADGHAVLFGQSETPLEDQLKRFEASLDVLEITDRHVAGLKNLLALHSNQVQIVLIETPTHPAFYATKRKVRNLYPDFENMLAFQAAQAGVPLWLTRETLEFPQENWHDLAHLNDEGSTLFSREFGRFLAAVYPSQTSP
jgi:hypothetical protein